MVVNGDARTNGGSMMYCLSRRVLAAPVRTYHPTGAPCSVLARLPTERPDRRLDGTPGDTMALLEAAAIALGAADLTPERIGVARAADRALRACTHDLPAAARLARLFHHTLLTACPNRHMLDLIAREGAGTHRRQDGAVQLHELSRVVDDHETILDMIAAGAPSGELERLLREHTSSSALCALGGA